VGTLIVAVPPRWRE